MDILSSNKVLQLEPLAPLIRQGERLADNPVFVLPKMRDGIDQTSLAWEIRATSDHDTIVIQSLTADLTGTDIRLPWVVEGEFTAVAGALYITLCGKSATSDIVVKYVGSTALRVLAAEEGIYAPPPNIAEQTYQQRAAAEAAAASAGAALAETQSLKNQVQVIVAGNEAYTKSESNARFAGALVVKESGNPITVYPDATGAPITAVSLRGKTTQSGTGDPSPTNIRPISGISASISVNGTVYAPSVPIKLYGQNEVYDTWEPCVMVDGVLRSRHTQRWLGLVLDGTETLFNNGATSTISEWTLRVNDKALGVTNVISDKLKTGYLSAYGR